LIYESGAIAARPDTLPLSIGDPELSETALTTVSVPEMFAYWLQGGRVSVGFLGGAQIDRFGNINSTVIGEYAHPTVRLPGAGGAPEIASACGRIFVIMPQSPRSFVPTVDFITSFGHGKGGDERQRLGLTTAGTSLVCTDLCVLRPHPQTKELEVVSVHPGVTAEQIMQATGWGITFADDVGETSLPTEMELATLRDLPPPLAAEVARRWLVASGVPPHALDAPVLSRLLEMATDAAAPARRHFPGGVLVRRRGRVLSVDAESEAGGLRKR